MAGFDRSKIKTTTAAALKQQQTELDQQRPKSNRIGYHEIKNGAQKFRIAPYHPEGGGKSFNEPRTVSYFELKSQKRDASGQVIEGKFEIKRRPVFNSKVHGGLKEDLAEAYMNCALKKAIPEYAGKDKELAALIWKSVTGDYATKKNGIKPQDSWVLYAWKSEGVDDEGNDIWGKLGLLEIKPSVKDGMTEQAVEFGSPDPFTDVDEGIAIIITYNEDAKKPADYYKVKLNKKREGMSEQYIPSPLTDAQLEEWDKAPSLYKKYKNVFNKDTFKLQLEGLERFDIALGKEFEGFSVLQYEEFLDLADKIEQEVPEAPEKEGEEGEEKEEKPKPQVSKGPAPKPTLPKKKVEVPVMEELLDGPADDEEEQEEEEVKEEIIPPTPSKNSLRDKLKSNGNGTKKEEEKQPAHIAEVDNRLGALRKKLGK